MWILRKGLSRILYKSNLRQEKSMERVMGLDVGDKTIGVAISDLLQMTAQGLTTIKRESKEKDYSALNQL